MKRRIIAYTVFRSLVMVRNQTIPPSTTFSRVFFLTIGWFEVRSIIPADKRSAGSNWKGQKHLCMSRLDSTRLEGASKGVKAWRASLPCYRGKPLEFSSCPFPYPYAASCPTEGQGAPLSSPLLETDRIHPLGNRARPAELFPWFLP